MVPYGGPIRPPVYRVDPPSPRQREQDKRFFLLLLTFIAAGALLLNGNVPASIIAFVLWYAIKRLWKRD
jgi:hypothetical protein